MQKNYRKEAKPMQSKYEVPQLTLIGEAEEVVMGSFFGGVDLPQQSAADFEFELD